MEDLYDHIMTTFMTTLLRCLWDDRGQDVAEYAAILAVMLELVVGTVRSVEHNSNTVFSSVASSVN